MSRLTPNTKHIIFELEVNEDRNTLQLIEAMAKAIYVAPSERQRHEYLQLMHVRDINKQEATDAETRI